MSLLLFSTQKYFSTVSQKGSVQIQINNQSLEFTFSLIAIISYERRAGINFFTDLENV